MQLTRFLSSNEKGPAPRRGKTFLGRVTIALTAALALLLAQPIPSAFADIQWSQLGEDIDGAAPGDRSGYSVALSDDGRTVAIGSYLGNGGTGQVRVFRYSDGAWGQFGGDINGAGGNFGRAVAISADGLTVAVGAPSKTVGSWNSAGTVQVFTFDQSASAWLQRGATLGGGEALEALGSAVSLSSDGTALAVGSPGRNSEAGRTTVYDQVFTDGSFGWSPRTPIEGGAGDRSGDAVALNDNGDVLAVGEPYGGSLSTAGSGTARVYDWDGTSSTWTQRQPTLSALTTGDLMGRSVALNGTGDIVAVGASLYGTTNVGEVRAWRFNTETMRWQRLGSSLVGTGFNAYLGTSVALNNSGTRLAAGGWSGNFARVWDFVDSDWVPVGEPLLGEATDDSFGISLSLDSSGDTLAVGGFQNDGGGLLAGHTRVFQAISPTPAAENSSRERPLGNPGIFLTVSAEMGTPQGGTRVIFGADRIQPGAPFSLILYRKADLPGAPRILSRGVVGLNGSLEGTMELPPLPPGRYTLAFTSISTSGHSLQLGNVIEVSASGLWSGITPEERQPLIRW